MRHATFKLLTGAAAVVVSGCLGPPVLERQVLGYDEVTKMLDEKLLLLNIAPVRQSPAMRGMLGIRGSRAAGRKVRIHFPPAGSLLRTRLSQGVLRLSLWPLC